MVTSAVTSTVTRKNWLTHPAIATGIAVNVFVLGLAIAWSGPDPKQLWRLLGEDGIVEWMQFLCFTVIAGLLNILVICDAFAGPLVLGGKKEEKAAEAPPGD